jgi:outer membrane protein TolC
MKNWNRNRIRITAGMFSCVVLFNAGLKAQKTFTVSDCIQYAFEHNQLLNAASKDTSIAEIGIQRVKGDYLPRVNLASAFQYYFTKRNTIIEGGTPLAPPSLPYGKALAVDVGYNHAWYPSLNVTQLIFSPSYRNSYNIALQSQQLQSQEVISFKIDLIAGIYRAFNTYRLLEKQARFLEENIARIDTLAELTRIKFESGAGVKIEVNRVEVTGNRMKGELVNVRNGHMEALLTLQFQMNYLEPDSMILVGDVTIPHIVSKADTIMRQLLESYPAFRIESKVLQTQVAMADESIKLEQARAKPSVGADGSIGYTPGSNQIGTLFQAERWQPFSYIGVNIGIPIFNGLDVKRAVSQRKLQASQSRNYLDQFTTQFENEKKTTYVQIKNSLERYKYADANLKLASTNIELLHEAFVNGVADNQDLILGENDLYENQALYFNELLDLMLNEIEGQRVTGSFNPLAGM